MNKNHFYIYILALCLIQVLINNFLNFSHLLYISLLPLAVFCLPGKQVSIPSLILTFLTGIIIDVTSNGVVGITSCALLLCVFLRPLILKLAYTESFTSAGDDYLEEERLSKDMIISIALLCAIYFLVYCWIDSAGTLRWSYALLKWLYSFLSSTVLCVLIKSTIIKGR